MSFMSSEMFRNQNVFIKTFFIHSFSMLHEFVDNFYKTIYVRHYYRRLRTLGLCCTYTTNISRDLHTLDHTFANLRNIRPRQAMPAMRRRDAQRKTCYFAQASTYSTLYSKSRQAHTNTITSF